MSAGDRFGASGVVIRDFAGRETATALAAGYIASTTVYDVDDPEELGWQDQALCAQVDPEIFFPEKGGSVRDPKRVCRSCEVRAECLEYALEHDEKFGIWGGVSERERRRFKRIAA
jgi:WhiB family redox-sensing transcriptional regulator